MDTAIAARPAPLRRARLLEIFTIAWNSLEGIIAIGLGLLAGSIARCSSCRSWPERSTGWPGSSIVRHFAAHGTRTILCAYLSAMLLAGLALNAQFIWWWADPVAALGMVPIIVREGLGAWRGEHD